MKTLSKVLMMIAVVAVAMTSCKDENNGRLRDDAKIYINGATLKNVRYGKDRTLTAAEIVRLDSLTLMATNERGGDIQFGEYFCFANNNLDTVNNRIAMKAGNLDEIESNVFLGTSKYTHATQFYITKWWYSAEERKLVFDTIAYIPEQQRLEAAEQIIKLWNTEDWDTLYALFENAFTFVPCTGAEFKELQEKGLN